jgi:hypothetical protein
MREGEVTRLPELFPASLRKHKAGTKDQATTAGSGS